MTRPIRPADPFRPCEHAFYLAAAYDRDSEIPVWDEGWGRLWLVMDNIGAWVIPIGVIRARTPHEALECAIDEIFWAPSDDEIAEYEADYADCVRHGVEPPDLPDGWCCRGSSEPSNGARWPRVTSLYATISSDFDNPIRKLTRKVAEKLGITLEWELYESLKRAPGA